MDASHSPASPAEARASPDDGSRCRDSASGAHGNDTLDQVQVLPAYVESYWLQATSNGGGRARTLDDLAARLDTEIVTATAAQARGAFEIAAREPYAALGSLRTALAVWQAIDAPYLAAKTRTAIAHACYGLGDEDGATHELAAKCPTFERLGARPAVLQAEAARQAYTSEQRHVARPHPARARGATTPRDGPNQQTNRDRAHSRGENGRPAREQHPREALRSIARRRNGVRVPASTALKHAIRRMRKNTHAASLRVGYFCRALPAASAYRWRIVKPTTEG